MAEKVITVKVRVNPSVEPHCEMFRHSEKSQALNAWKDKDGAIIVEHENGKRVRLLLP